MCIEIYEYKTADITVLYTNVSALDINMEYRDLSAYRIKKISVLKNIKDKRLALGAELLLIEAIKRYFPKISIPLEIEASQHGKPYIKGESGVHFSIAHSEDIAVCVISCKPVGVDVERKSRISERIRNRYFTESEKNCDFCYIWTRKEAVLKAEGIGITVGLDTFDVSENTTVLNGNKYTLVTFEPKISGYYISLAW